MKGILLKDLYIAKSGIIVTLTALFVLAFGLSFLLDASSILMLAPAISTVAVYMSITNDASSKWNKNVITMPVSRDQIIGAKYNCCTGIARDNVLAWHDNNTLFVAF